MAPSLGIQYTTKRLHSTSIQNRKDGNKTQMDNKIYGLVERAVEKNTFLRFAFLGIQSTTRSVFFTPFQNRKKGTNTHTGIGTFGLKRSRRPFSDKYMLHP